MVAFAVIHLDRVEDAGPRLEERGAFGRRKRPADFHALGHFRPGRPHVQPGFVRAPGVLCGAALRRQTDANTRLEK